MELLRDLVKEQGIVSIIEDYKTEMELYEHKQKFKHSLKEIDDIDYSIGINNVSRREFKNKINTSILESYNNYKDLTILSFPFNIEYIIDNAFIFKETQDNYIPYKNLYSKTTTEYRKLFSY